MPEDKIEWYNAKWAFDCDCGKHVLVGERMLWTRINGATRTYCQVCGNIKNPAKGSIAPSADRAPESVPVLLCKACGKPMSIQGIQVYEALDREGIRDVMLCDRHSDLRLLVYQLKRCGLWPYTKDGQIKHERKPKEIDGEKVLE